MTEATFSHILAFQFYAKPFIGQFFYKNLKTQRLEDHAILSFND